MVLPAEAPAPVAVVMPSAVLGDGTDSEYVNVPFFVPHFFLDCSVGGPSAIAEVFVHALIDDRSDSVLINPTYVDRLGLSRRKLTKPKVVTMAVGGGGKEVFSFDEWVATTVVSSDQVWCKDG
jgi:hypothetical protein